MIIISIIDKLLESENITINETKKEKILNPMRRGIELFESKSGNNPPTVPNKKNIIASTGEIKLIAKIDVATKPLQAAAILKCTLKFAILYPI
jgi:hypothetical protein